MHFRFHCCTVSAQKHWRIALKHRHCCAAYAQERRQVNHQTPSVLRCICAGPEGPLRRQRPGYGCWLTAPRDFWYDRFGGRVMRFQGWVSLCSSSRRQAAVVCSFRHVRRCSRSAPTMAEEAKKLAAYAAVDNHVQVPSAHLSNMSSLCPASNSIITC